MAFYSIVLLGLLECFPFHSAYAKSPDMGPLQDPGIKSVD